MTFADLEESSTRMANALCRRGIKAGDRIAITLPNGLEFVQALLAIVKSGAIAVPVNTRLSADEVSHILGDSRPAALIVDESLSGARSNESSLNGLGTSQTLTIGTTSGSGIDVELAQLADEGCLELPEVPITFDDCVISYTSGTTGKPKGAVLTQANYIILNGFMNGRMWSLTPADRQLITTPLAQRTGLARVMNMICHGCSLVIPPKFDAGQTATLISQEQVTFMGSVPTVARMLLPEIQRDPDRFVSLRTFVATGEAFPQALKEQLHAALPQLRIFSFYAMTEVGLVASMAPEEQFSRPNSAGRVEAGVETRFMGANGGEVPSGAVGELWVRTGEPGRFLSMRGYFNQPEMNAETMNDGWIATGDMGRLDEDRYLYLVDRKKDMIISGGFNVYSNEVELVISELPEVRDVAVVGVPDATFGEAVAAYIELETGAVLHSEDVIDHCRRRIASYKKPRQVSFVPQLPRNSAGKVLKRALYSPTGTMAVDRERG
jgi:long-chain acyl-CoA synthetase